MIFTEQQMVNDLRITFPTLRTKPLREFSSEFQHAGLWTFQDGPHVMPDGDPIFDDLANGEEPYDGRVHEGFTAWLDRRGWYVATYDGVTHFLVPDEAGHGGA